MSSTLRPGISVVVRSIARASLHVALRSVEAQGRDDVEVLVVDAAGSGTMSTSTQPAPRWINLGRALHRTEAAQAGLDAVATRWAIFLDDDDWLLEGHLAKLAAALEGAPDAVLAHTGVETVDEQGRITGTFDAAFEPWELVMGNRFPIHAALFDVERLRAGGVAFDRGFDVYEDWDFWLQLATLGRFVHVGGVSARYLVHGQASQVHHIGHGDEPFWRIWRKWWSLAPRDWWNQALYQREVVVGLKSERAGLRTTLLSVTADRDAKAEALHNANAERDAQAGVLRQLSRQFDETVAALRQTQQRLADESAALLATQRRLAECEFALDAERERARQTAEHHAAELAHRDGLDRLLRNAHAAADLQRRRQLEDLAALQRSTSWRLTAPLRSADAKLRAIARRAGTLRRRLGWTPGVADYRHWIQTVEEPEQVERRAAIAPMLGAAEPLISVLMPVFEPQLDWLDEAIASLQAQWWPHWQLCLADDGSSQAGVRERLRGWAAREPRITLVERKANGGIAAATNDALAVARGRWVAFMDQDDRLAPPALAEVALAAHADADAEVIFSDEDKLDAKGRRNNPHFKPGFSVERLRGQNFMNHLTALRRERLVALGGLREGYEGAQDHELLLRSTEALAPERVHHIPQVLYHWRAAPGSTAASPAHKAQALQASLRAVNESLARCEPGAAAEGLPRLHWLRVRYPVPVPRPTVGGIDGPFGGDQPVQWWLAERLSPAGEGWFDEMLSLLMRPGVGLVGGAWVDARGKRVDGARRFDEASGRWVFIDAAFGAQRMVQDAACLAPGCWMMRRDVYEGWRDAGGASAFAEGAAVAAFIERVSEQGWRSLWTPFAAFVTGR